jgi:hypothetical protein
VGRANYVQYRIDDKPRDGESRLILELAEGQPIVIDGDIRIHLDHFKHAGTDGGTGQIGIQIIGPREVPISRKKDF